MKIKISPENSSAIERALEKVNGRSASHAYTRYSEIAALAERAEQILRNFLAKQDFSGAQWRETSGDAVANSYSYSRKATAVIITRGSKEWFLTDVSAKSIHAEGGGRGRLFMTQEQDAIARDRLASNYCVISG